jgi:uncharacterized membrane protein HdeD (DUF308 family)
MDMTIDRTERVAKSNNLLIIKGVLAIGWGAVAVFAAYLIPMGLVVAFGVLNFVAAGLTLAYAYNNRHLKISHQWLLLEGIVELAAGVVFAFFVTNLAQFITYMSYGIIFIVTLQFIYGYTLILTGRFSAQNMLMRFASVLAGTIIAVGLLAKVFTSGVSLIVVGSFSVLYGILNMQFATKLKNVIMGPAN